MGQRWRIAIAIFCLCAAASAQVALTSLDTTVAVQTDGSAIVVERFTPWLPAGAIVWRTQNAFQGAFGLRTPREIEILDVSDGNGQKLAFSQRNTGNLLELSIVGGGASEIKISYSVSSQASLSA